MHLQQIKKQKFKLQTECLIFINVFLKKFDTYIIQLHGVWFGTFCLFHFRQEDFYITTENYPEFLAPCMGYAPFVDQGCGIVGTCPLWSVWATTKMTCVRTTVTLGPLYILPTDSGNSIYCSHDNYISKMWSKRLHGTIYSVYLKDTLNLETFVRSKYSVEL